MEDPGETMDIRIITEMDIGILHHHLHNRTGVEAMGTPKPNRTLSEDIGTHLTPIKTGTMGTRIIGTAIIETRTMDTRTIGTGILDPKQPNRVRIMVTRIP